MCLVHSVQTHFVAQTGDPSGTGRSGGESIYRRLYGDQAKYFEGDLLPKIKHLARGSLSMVSVGNNMFGSEFLVTLSDNLESLDAGQHCVFGKIVEGEEILETLNNTICDGENRPYQDIRITHTIILDDPFPDPPGLEIPDRSPEPSDEMKSSSSLRIAADEDLNENDGLTEREVSEMMAQKEARAQATILEMVGDLPEADCAPPENVLFVCKLNPVTTDDDLEIIFSRFGKVVSCEVIRDRKTGDSLQYAFVEFEDKTACESAYFKMDNVLIDDRRIHVDFSQSVSKFRWKGKGRLEIVGQEKNDHKPHTEDHERQRSQVLDQSHSTSRQREKKSERASDHRRSRSPYSKKGMIRNSPSTFRDKHRHNRTDGQRKHSERYRHNSSDREERSHKKYKYRSESSSTSGESDSADRHHKTKKKHPKGLSSEKHHRSSDKHKNDYNRHKYRYERSGTTEDSDSYDRQRRKEQKLSKHSR